MSLRWPKRDQFASGAIHYAVDQILASLRVNSEQ